MIYDIAIIGGGASGLMAAVSAADELNFQKRKGQVVVLEGNAKLGKKLLATGNGRCNLSNAHLSPRRYHGDTALAAPLLETFDAEYIRNRFASMGLLTCDDTEGRIYPYNKQAAAVLRVLENRAEELGVSCELGFNAFSVIKSGPFFVIKSEDGREVRAHKCILASGGLASPKHSCGCEGYKILRALGHRVTPTYPCLVQLTCPEKFIKNLAGVRAKANVRLLSGDQVLGEENGELLFADKALSGICIFQLSVYAARFFADEKKSGKKELQVRIDFTPDLTEETLLNFLKKHRDSGGGTVGDFLCGVLNMKIGREIMKLCKADVLDEAAALRDADLSFIVQKIKGLTLRVNGSKGFEDAQITAGGVPLNEIDLKTFESRKVKGLYICGEVLNIHGECGGYNLHFAWVSGLLAGRGAAQ